jgi:hypothetical protein
MKKVNLIIILLATTLSVLAQTRGAAEGEIYYSTSTYIDSQEQIHTAIFRSTDHGAHLQLQYESTTNPSVGEMAVGRVLGDATPGALYNYGSNELWVSFDYGVNWVYREDYNYAAYAAGLIDGVIYRRSNYNLYKSNNYGLDFNVIVESLSEPLSEVGNQVNELYGFTGSTGQYNLYHSLNEGSSFNKITIDSVVAYWQIMGNNPIISRGTVSDEIYLASWWPDNHYKIFHSIDNGYTWTQQFESDYIELYYWGLTFTAGRQPGSFYVFRNYLEDMGTHRELYIDYSSDYGQTFTTYHHILDSSVSVTETKQEYTVRTYPNPFVTTVTIEHPWLTDTGELRVYGVTGELVCQKELEGSSTNITLSHLPLGVYIYSIETNSRLVYQGVLIKN